MPTYTYPGVKLVDDRVIYQMVGSYTTSNSPKVNGKLRLRANAFNQSLLHGVRFIQEPYITVNGKLSHAGGATAGTSFWPSGWLNASVPASLVNQAHARFINRTRSAQTASLGVTLGSWRQSVDMIYKRTTQITRKADARIAELKTTRGRKRLKRALRKIDRKFARENDPASLYLEGIFGWVPLFQDVHDSLATVTTANEYARKFIRASASRSDVRAATPNKGETPRCISGHARRTFKVTESALVVVENPNLHLGQRLGLNPALVAWDLVPWSFVVNMFVNVNQLIENISPFAGLSISNASVTKTTYTIFNWSGYYRQYTKHGYKNLQVGAFQRYITKTRTLGTANFQLQLKLPDASLGLAATASALLDQKFKTITKLVRAVRR